MLQLSVEQTRLLRVRSQQLHPRASSNVAQLVHECGGLQSQEWPAANLAIRARTTGLTAADVKQAREVDRSIVLTWAMRGTMHLVAAEDVRWLLTLLGPQFIRQGERRYQQLHLDDETRRTAAHLIRDLLANRGPLTRAELAQSLAAQGIPVEGQAIAHLVSYAALSGIICFGPERGGKLTYVVLDDWLESEKPRSPKDMQAELAFRYLQAYGPARPADFSIWSGISITPARAAFESISADLVEVEVMGSPAWMLKRSSAWLDEVLDEPVVRLLPRYDSYLLGYTSRDFMVPQAYAKRIHPGGGQINQSLIVDGLATATWRSERKKAGSLIVIEPFEPLSSDLLPYLQADVVDLGRFLQQEIRLHDIF